MYPIFNVTAEDKQNFTFKIIRNKNMLTEPIALYIWATCYHSHVQRATNLQILTILVLSANCNLHIFS